MSCRALIGLAITTLAASLACGPRSLAEFGRQASQATEVVEEGGATPLIARLSIRPAEAMAIQEVPYVPGPEQRARLDTALDRYRKQWTFLLSIGPKPGVRPIPGRPFALDIENNGGQWHDHSRNLQRLMFEMGSFIHLKTRDGREIDPVLVEFQRSFGMGLDRTFMIVFPTSHEGKPVVPPFEIEVKEFGQGMGTLHLQVAKQGPRLSPSEINRIWQSNQD